MDAILNLLVIGFAGLIAYWWANQGLYSSVLHLVCVICAGVLAFATWEPVAGIFAGVPSLLAYSKGIGLLLPFAVYLFVLRLLADKLAPDNLNFPHWANLSLGGVFGVASGVLTVGISLIGIGHTHSSKDLLGVTGAARTTNTRGQPKLDSTALWIPVHIMTGNFYAMLSKSAFAPTLSRPTLASEYPMIGQQALGLHRDTYSKTGRLARTTAAPGSIRIDSAMLTSEIALPDNRTISAYLVNVHFDAGATTEGQGFAISASQLRLVGRRDGQVGAWLGHRVPDRLGAAERGWRSSRVHVRRPRSFRLEPAGHADARCHADLSRRRVRSERATAVPQRHRTPHPLPEDRPAVERPAGDGDADGRLRRRWRSEGSRRHDGDQPRGPRGQ